MPLTELPFGLAGHIFRSPMPFGIYDPREEVFNKYIQNGVSVIVLLAEDEECLKKAGRNLRLLYEEKGFNVIHLPIRDFGVPSNDKLIRAVNAVIAYAQTGRNIAIHCSAGIGRTGLFVALLAKQVLSLSGDEAIAWVRQYISGAVETAEQRQLVVGDSI
jgi:protein-tyrosine phosphatase